MGIYGDIPKILYKYRSINSEFTKKILSDGEIYFAITAELQDKNEKEFFIFEAGHHALDANQLAFFPREAYKKRLTDKYKKNEGFGILSLCGNKESVQIWNDYANEFNGICIGFDWEKFNLYFSGSYPLVKNEPRRVIYQKNPILIREKSIPTEQWLEIFCTKSSKYSYEQEYRMFHNKGKIISQKIRHAIKEIIFGYKINEIEINKIKDLISDINDVSHYTAEKIDGEIKILKIN